MKRRIVLALFCLLGIATNAAFHGPALGLSFRGVTDFISLYCGARLVGTPGLYNPPRMLEVQKQAAGWSSTHRLFCRPPYEAAFLWPVARLPYLQAYAVWQALSIVAVALFVWLWPMGSRATVAAACCWSYPVFTGLAQGQDDSFVLAAIAASVCLVRASRPFAAGLLFTLCAAKFHLFLLVPFWIVSQRLWRFAGGFAAGAAGLAAISFLAGGPQWPRQYLALLADPATNPSPQAMPNVHGIFAGMPYDLALEIVAAAAVAAVAVWSFRRASFEYGLAMTIGAGLLISRHAFVADCALLIPGLLVLSVQAKTRAERLFALAMLAPFVYVGALTGSAGMALLRAALACNVALLAWIAWRTPAPARDAGEIAR